MADQRPPLAWRARIFSITWLSYFSYYQCRKTVSIAKAFLIDAGKATKNDFALVETLYSVGYAAGQFIWGFTADAISPRRMLGIGMLATAGLLVLFGIGDSVGIWVLAFGLNGLFQASGWPNNSRIMASWFSAEERGVVLGWWGTCYQVGPIAADAAGTYLLTTFDWRWALFGPAIWTGVVACAVFLLVRDHPHDEGFEDPEGALPAETDFAARRAATRDARREAWAKLVRSPTIWLLGANYFAVKLMRYALWFWLPTFFLELGFREGGAYGYMATSFSLGGVFGVVISGYLADRMFGKRRIAVAMVMMLLLAAALALYNLAAPTSIAGNYVILFTVGVLLFGPDSLVSGAAAQDAGGPHAAAAAAGFVNGVGSTGQVAQGFLVAYVSEAHG